MSLTKPKKGGHTKKIGSIKNIMDQVRTLAKGLSLEDDDGAGLGSQTRLNYSHMVD